VYDCHSNDNQQLNNIYLFMFTKIIESMNFGRVLNYIQYLYYESQRLNIYFVIHVAVQQGSGFINLIRKSIRKKCKLFLK
jgi:hypothetical protein